jgi:hypothetical protein
VVAAHLSEQNNRADIVRRVLATALAWDEAAIQVADGPNGSPWLSA